MIILRQKLYAIRSSFSDTIDLGSGLKMVKADIGALGKFLRKVSKKIRTRQDNFIHYDIFLGMNKIGNIQIEEESNTEISTTPLNMYSKYINYELEFKVLKGLISYIRKSGYKEIIMEEIDINDKLSQQVCEKLGFKYVGEPYGYNSVIDMKLKL